MDLYIIRKKLNMGIPLTNIKLRVTDYSRVSTDSIKQKKSLQNQIEHFDQYIKNNANWIYIKGYVDEGISGTTDIKRDNFMRMIEDAKKGKFDLIITKEISRFSRNTLDSIKYTRKLLEYGVAVLFVNDNINTALPDSELRLTIMASMAQDEVRRLSERVKFGMRRAQNKGELLGNNIIYGYRKEKGKLYQIEKEAEIIKKIFNMYVLENKSLTKISKILNNDSSSLKKWSATSISRIIRNPKYKGYYCGHKTEVIDYMTKKIKYFNEDKWIVYKDKKRIKPIVDEIIWDKANKKLKENKKTCSKKLYLYSGKIICKNDNNTFYRREFRRRKKDITWICSKYLKEGKKYCSIPSLREKELNIIFIDLISKLEIDKEQIKNEIISYYKKISNDKKIIKKKIEKDLILKQKEKLLDLNISGNISKKEFLIKNNKLNIKIKDIESNIDRLLKDKNSYNINLLSKEITKVLNSKFIFDKIINTIIDKIIVSKKNNDLILEVKLLIKDVDIADSCFEFKRGYDTTSTRRYKIKYFVKYDIIK